VLVAQGVPVCVRSMLYTRRAIAPARQQCDFARRESIAACSFDARYSPTRDLCAVRVCTTVRCGALCVCFGVERILRDVRAQCIMHVLDECVARCVFYAALKTASGARAPLSRMHACSVERHTALQSIHPSIHQSIHPSVTHTRRIERMLRGEACASRKTTVLSRRARTCSF
jgi:hypothetical protein